MSLVKAIARSFLWHEQLISGEVAYAKDLLGKHKINSKSYINKILKLRFLAPDIMEAIILGNDLSHWTLDKITQASNHSWDEQRKLLG